MRNNEYFILIFYKFKFKINNLKFIKKKYIYYYIFFTGNKKIKINYILIL